VLPRIAQISVKSLSAYDKSGNSADPDLLEHWGCAEVTGISSLASTVRHHPNGGSLCYCRSTRRYDHGRLAPVDDRHAAAVTKSRKPSPKTDKRQAAHTGMETGPTRARSGQHCPVSYRVDTDEVAFSGPSGPLLTLGCVNNSKNRNAAKNDTHFSSISKVKSTCGV
jgi:hypothetical protein